MARVYTKAQFRTMTSTPDDEALAALPQETLEIVARELEFLASDPMTNLFPASEALRAAAATMRGYKVFHQMVIAAKANGGGGAT